MYLHNYCYIILFLASLKQSQQQNPLIDENFFEGDIIGIDSDTILQSISQSDYDISNEDSEQFAADGVQIGHGAASSDKSKLWPDGKVFYKISEEFNSTEIKFIRSAFNDFHRYTCIKFIEQTDQIDYIKIVKSGCFSHIGKTGGEQPLGLASKCLKNESTAKGIAIHEIMHAIGFFHEQSRSDRDDYVEIFLDNLEDKAMESNFMKYELDKLQNLHTEYDYESIMHYGATDFASPGKETIKPKEPGVRIGQRKGLSQIDIREINLLYKCNIVSPTTLPKIASKTVCVSSASSIRWGKKLKIDYNHSKVRNVVHCKQMCEEDVKCHAMSFDRSVSASSINCYFFNSADNYTSEDAETHWGTWIKPTSTKPTSIKPTSTKSTSTKPTRVKTRYISCQSLGGSCKQTDGTCMDEGKKSVFYDTGCEKRYFPSRGLADEFCCVPTKKLKTHYVSCQSLGGSCKQTDGTCMDEGKKSVFYDTGCEKRYFPSRGLADEYCCIPSKKRKISCQALGGTCKQTDGTCADEGKKSVFYDYGCQKRNFPRGFVNEYCCV